MESAERRSNDLGMIEITPDWDKDRYCPICHKTLCMCSDPGY